MPFATQTTNLPGGITNARTDQTMGRAGTPDPTWSQLCLSEFNTLNAADYTQSGTGVPAFALSASYGPGGVIGLTTSAGAADSATIIQPTPSFQLLSTKNQFFKGRFQVPAGSLACSLAVGMAASTALNDGLYFFKAANVSTWVLRSVVGGAVTDTPLPAACVIADGAWVEVGFHCDAQGNVEAFFNPTTGNVSQQASVNGRGRVASNLALSQTQQLLSLFANVTNAAAVARTLAIDFLMMSSER